jgi:hypothetical protein
MFALNLISTFLWLSLGRNLYWWTICPEYIIRTVVSFLALAWFIRYIYCQNLQPLIYLSIVKTKVRLPQVNTTLAECGYPFWTLLPQVNMTLAECGYPVWTLYFIALFPQVNMTLADCVYTVRTIYFIALLPQVNITLAECGYPLWTL